MLIHNHSLDGKNAVDFELPIYGVKNADEVNKIEGQTFGLIVQKKKIVSLSTSSDYSYGIFVNTSKTKSTALCDKTEVWMIVDWYDDGNHPLASYTSFTSPVDFTYNEEKHNICWGAVETDENSEKLSMFDECHLNEICFPNGVYVECGAFFGAHIDCVYFGEVDREVGNNAATLQTLQVPINLNFRGFPIKSFTLHESSDDNKHFCDTVDQCFVSTKDSKTIFDNRVNIPIGSSKKTAQEGRTTRICSTLQAISGTVSDENPFFYDAQNMVQININDKPRLIFQ